MKWADLRADRLVGLASPFRLRPRRNASVDLGPSHVIQSSSPVVNDFGRTTSATSIVVRDLNILTRRPFLLTQNTGFIVSEDGIFMDCRRMEVGGKDLVWGRHYFRFQKVGGRDRRGPEAAEWLKAMS